MELTDNIYQISCESIRFHHSLIKSDDIVKVIKRLKSIRAWHYEYYLALDRYHHPFNNAVSATTPLIKAMKAFDSERRICLAYYDFIYMKRCYPHEKIFAIEGYMPRSDENNMSGIIHRAISMWESMINMMNTLNSSIIVGDMLQLQCYAGINQVRFYGLWIMSSESKANVSEVCQGFGLQQLQYRYLRTCDSNSNDKAMYDISRDHLSELFQSLIINYTNKRCDREKTIRALYQADIDVIDHDRCLVRCCIPSQQSI